MLPTPADVSDLLGTLFGCSVTATEDAPAAPWALAVFEAPERGLVAVAAADMAATATLGAAIVGSPADEAEDALARGKVTGDLWDNFAEVANVMNGLFMDDVHHPRVVIKSVQRAEGDQWHQLVAPELPQTHYRLEVEGYPTGHVTFVSLGDRAAEEFGVATPAAPAVPIDTRWRPLDFRQPTGVSRGLLRTLHLHLTDVARNMASTLSGRLNTKVHKRVQQMRHVARSELVTSIDGPALATSFRVEGMEGRFVMVWQLELAMALLDLQLGGTGMPLATPRYPTALDLALLEPMVQQVVAGIPGLLQPFVPDRQLAAVDLHIDLDLTRHADAASGTWLATWMAVEVAGIDHEAVVAVPMLALQPLLDRIMKGGRTDVALGQPAFGSAVLGVPANVSVQFPREEPAALRGGHHPRRRQRGPHPRRGRPGQRRRDAQQRRGVHRRHPERRCHRRGRNDDDGRGAAGRCRPAGGRAARPGGPPRRGRRSRHGASRGP